MKEFKNEENSALSPSNQAQSAIGLFFAVYKLQHRRYKVIEPNGVKGYLFGGTKRTLLYKAMDTATMRSRAIAQNLSNVTTPGYKRKEVTFEEEVKRVLEMKLKGNRTDNEHLEISKDAALRRIKPLAYEANDPTLPGEINNVDVDLESSKMAENQIMYNYLTKFAGFEKFLSAIKGSPS